MILEMIRILFEFYSIYKKFQHLRIQQQRLMIQKRRLQLVCTLQKLFERKMKLNKAYSMVKLNLYENDTTINSEIRDYDKQCQGIHIFDKLIKRKLQRIKIQTFYKIYYHYHKKMKKNDESTLLQQSKNKFYIPIQKQTKVKDRRFHKKTNSLMSYTLGQIAKNQKDQKNIENPQELKTNRHKRTKSNMIGYPFSIENSMSNSLCLGTSRTRYTQVSFPQSQIKINTSIDNTNTDKIKTLLTTIQQVRRSNLMKIANNDFSLFSVETPKKNTQRKQLMNCSDQFAIFHCCCCKCEKK